MEAAAAAVHNQSLLGRSTGPGGHGNGGGGAMGATAATAFYTRTATPHPNAERVNLATRFPLEALLHHQRMSMMGAGNTSNGTIKRDCGWGREGPLLDS
jgi:hypothetical protein